MALLREQGRPALLRKERRGRGRDAESREDFGGQRARRVPVARIATTPRTSAPRTRSCSARSSPRCTARTSTSSTSSRRTCGRSTRCPTQRPTRASPTRTTSSSRGEEVTSYAQSHPRPEMLLASRCTAAEGAARRPRRSSRTSTRSSTALSPTRAASCRRCTMPRPADAHHARARCSRAPAPADAVIRRRGMTTPTGTPTCRSPTPAPYGQVDERVVMRSSSASEVERHQWAPAAAAMFKRASRAATCRSHRLTPTPTPPQARRPARTRPGPSSWRRRFICSRHAAARRAGAPRGRGVGAEARARR